MHLKKLVFLIFLFILKINFAQKPQNVPQLYPKHKAKAQKTIQLDKKLHETSGLAFANGKLWTHNDDTDRKIYAISTQNTQIIQEIEIPVPQNTDWEEIATDQHHLYLADIGNNARGNRRNLAILKIPLHQLGHAPLTIDTIRFAYPEQTNYQPQAPNTTNFDSETIVAQPDTIYIFTKEWGTRYTSLYTVPNQAGQHQARLKTRFRTKALITGACYLPQQQTLALVGYDRRLRARVWLFWGFAGREFFSGKARKIKLKPSFLQAEGICSTDGKIFYISNETWRKRFVANRPAALRIYDFGEFLKN